MNWGYVIKDLLFGADRAFFLMYFAASVVLAAVALSNAWRWARVRQGPGARMVVAGSAAWLLGAVTWMAIVLIPLYGSGYAYAMEVGVALVSLACPVLTGIGVGRAVCYETGRPPAPRRELLLTATVVAGALAAFLTTGILPVFYARVSLVFLAATLPLVYWACRWRRLRPAGPRTLFLAAAVVLLLTGEPWGRFALLGELSVLNGLQSLGIGQSPSQAQQYLLAVFFRLALTGQLLLVFAFAGLVREEEERAEEAAAAALEREEAAEESDT